MIITIDGPVASGKSSIARALAHSLGFWYINSGLLYRAVAYAALKHYGLTIDTLSESVSERIISNGIKTLEYVWNGTSEQILYDKQDITGLLKDSRIDQAASVIATNALVRSHILSWIRQLAQTRDCVIDGRDTGTIVFPSADMKWYLTASVEVRAERWMNDQRKKGYTYTFDQAREIISERDMRDTTREIAPLTQADDAQLLDSSALSQEQVLAIIEQKTRALL